MDTTDIETFPLAKFRKKHLVQWSNTLDQIYGNDKYDNIHRAKAYVQSQLIKHELDRRNTIKQPPHILRPLEPITKVYVDNQEVTISTSHQLEPLLKLFA